MLRRAVRWAPAGVLLVLLLGVAASGARAQNRYPQVFERPGLFTLETLYEVENDWTLDVLDTSLARPAFDYPVAVRTHWGADVEVRRDYALVVTLRWVQERVALRDGIVYETDTRLGQAPNSEHLGMLASLLGRRVRLQFDASGAFLYSTGLRETFKPQLVAGVISAEQYTDLVARVERHLLVNAYHNVYQLQPPRDLAGDRWHVDSAFTSAQGDSMLVAAALVMTMRDADLEGFDGAIATCAGPVDQPLASCTPVPMGSLTGRYVPRTGAYDGRIAVEETIERDPSRDFGLPEGSLRFRSEVVGISRVRYGPRETSSRK